MKIASCGADALFEQYTIKEIQEIEKKLKNEIEGKKEELRQMVGERYRDLMEAADTITDMKTIAGNIAGHIKVMQERCVQFQQCNIQYGIVEMAAKKEMERRKNFSVTYSIAAQTKILMDTPTKIWTYMENHEFLNCALLYLLACHAHTSLLLNPEYKMNNLPLSFTFPVINHQWATITSFRDLLLQNCQNALESNDTTKRMTEHLCCIMLMDDIGTNEVFDMFLEKRLMALKKMFQVQDQGKSAKNQVCELVSILMNTLHLANEIFYPHHEDHENAEVRRLNLLVKTLQNITKKGFQGPITLLDLKTFHSFKYLPPTIADFTPKLKTSLTVVSEEETKKICETWIQNANKVFQKGLEQLLQYISTIKGLAAIHRSAAEQLEEHSKEWATTCYDVLTYDVDIWKTFLQPAFLNRVKAIISSQIQAATNTCISDIENFLDNMNCIIDSYSEHINDNVTKYVWSESPSDLSPGLGWLPLAQRKLWDGGSLGMKAKGYMPNVQIICKKFDAMLQTLTEDLSHFTTNVNSEKGLKFATKPVKTHVEDIPEVTSHVISVTEECIEWLLKYIKEQIDKSANEEKYQPRLVFIGQFCYGLTELCPNLQLCLITSNPVEFNAQKIFSLEGNGKQEDSHWLEVKANVIQHSNMSYRTWNQHIVRKQVNRLTEILCDCSPSSILRSSAQWDKTDIVEESEDGKTVKSTIYIPMQASVELQSILFEISCSINKAGGHALNRLVTQDIVLELLNCLLPVYNAASKEISDNPHLNQTRALQLLFDVNYLLGLMGPKESSDHPVRTQADEILNHLENQIDPFDLNVFTPSLQANLRKVVHRSMLLLGLLTPIDVAVPLGASRSSSQPTHSEQYNLLPVNTTTGRFTLLPTVSKTVQQSTRGESNVEMSPLKDIRMHSSSPSLSNTTNNSSVTKSASFYDRVTAMSSSWFGGQ